MILERHELCRYSRNRIDITREKYSLLPYPHNHRTSELGSEDGIWSLSIDHDESIRSHEASQDALEGREEVSIRECIQELRHHLRICLTVEIVSLQDEFSLELMVVLDDSIVHHEESHITGIMWMTIVLCDTTVGRPASMSDSRSIRSLRTWIFLHLGGEIRDLSHCLLEKYLSTRRERYESSRIIASILEISESLDEERNRIFLTIVGKYSAHNCGK